MALLGQWNHDDAVHENWRKQLASEQGRAAKLPEPVADPAATTSKHVVGQSIIVVEQQQVVVVSGSVHAHFYEQAWACGLRCF